MKRRGRLWHQNQPPWRDSYTLKRQDSFLQIRQKRGSNLPLCCCPVPMNPCEQPNPRATGCTRQGRFPTLSLSLPSFPLTRNSVWTGKTFPMEFPQKASVLMNKHSSQGEEKVFYWRILDQSPLLVLQQRPHFKKTFIKPPKHISPKFFLFNSQLSSQWGISAAQNKREQHGYLMPSSYWPPVPTQTWGLSVFVPQFSFQWGKVFACLSGELNSERVNFSFVFTLLWERTRALNWLFYHSVYISLKLLLHCIKKL